MVTSAAPIALPHIEPLWSAAGDERAGPGRLGAAYPGSLTFPRHTDRPTVVVNFVSTLDGVVSYATPEAAGGSAISGGFPPDRFLMGLLRARADAVLVGAGTVRRAGGRARTPAAAFPDAADDFAALRLGRGLAPRPTTVVISATGDLESARPGLGDPVTPVLIITTEAGRDRCAALAALDHVTVEVAGGDRVAPADLLAILAAAGMRLVVCEGGPHLLAELLAADAVDELFLTIAPQVAGRSAGHPRLGLVEGVAFGAAEAPWWAPISIARSGGHLFTRYRRAPGAEPKEAAQ